MSSDDPHAAVAEFKKAVNMSSKALSAWLTTEESKAVGFKSTENSESVVGYIHRHLVQRPAGDIGDTHWRHSLMNWGHDPQQSNS